MRRWHQLGLAARVIATEPFEERWIDFLRAWPKVRFAKGAEPMMAIFVKAQGAIPDIALKYGHEGLRLLVSLCRGLQRAAGESPFHLGCRTAVRERLTPTLRALVCNVEMPPAVLLDRQLARLAGIPAELVRRRKLDASHGARLDAGLATLESFADRLAFVRPPFTLDNIAAAADAFDAKLLLLDYAQRIQPPGNHGDRRNTVNALMDYLRQFAEAGVAAIVVAAVGRTRDAKGRSTYAADALNLASFRESPELEFGADDAYILAPDAKDAELVVLRHLKARHGEQRDIALTFDKARQAFTPRTSTAAKAKPDGKLQAALRSLWDRTATADKESAEETE